MGTYYIPRNYKGETRLLYIFTTKSLISTANGAGSIFFVVLSYLNLKMPGIIAMAVCAGIGYIIGAVKIPTIVGIPVTKKIGGEPISEIILRYIKYRQNRKIYTYSPAKRKKGGK